VRRLVALVGLAAFVAGCGRSPELSLDIRLPMDRHLLASVARLDLIATRDGRVLAQASFAGDASFVSLSGVSHGPRTVLTLDGVTTSGDVVGEGRTCPIDFEHGGTSAPLYFAPTNFFAPTVGAPAAARTDPVVVPLSDGTVLLAGGADAASPSAELFSPGSATFTPATQMALNLARERAEVVVVPGIGALVTGGVDPGGQPVATAELFDDVRRQFLSQPDDSRLDARVGHRAVLLADGHTVLISGGQSQTSKALASTVFVKVQPGDVVVVSAGPSLSTARYQHAAVVAVGVPVMIGGYALDGTPLSSIEQLQPADMTQPASFTPVASLRFPRAEATASLLLDGTILVVGGAGDANGTPRRDAELYNPITRTTTVFELAVARRGHTATVLSDGRVLVAGGIGLDNAGNPVALSSVELFAVGVGFVSERPLGAPRANHVAVPLCDGTVLVVGGGPTAEIYTPPAG
jgi:hypothetical protein